VGAVLGALFALSGSADAQTREADAERLFREGQKLLEERRFGEACPKFEAAYKKDGQLGTLLNLAFCHKEQGAIWYAWLEFREAEVKATELNRADRRDFAKARLAELQKQLPKVVLDPNPKHALYEVLVEDRKVWEAERGAVFAAEVGERKFTFRSKGKRQVTVLVTIAPSRNERVQHVPAPDMEDARPDEVAPAAEASKEAPTLAPPPAAEAPRDPGRTQRTAGWIALGVGGVGLVVGSVTGIMTLTSACAGLRGTNKTCPTSDARAADTTGALSTVSFVVAGVGVAGGLVLLLTAPSVASSAPRAGAGRHVAGVALTPRLGLGWAGLEGTF
jgi:hypothetical protein